MRSISLILTTFAAFVHVGPARAQSLPSFPVATATVPIVATPEAQTPYPTDTPVLVDGTVSTSDLDFTMWCEGAFARYLRNWTSVGMSDSILVATSAFNVDPETTFCSFTGGACREKRGHTCKLKLLHINRRIEIVKSDGSAQIDAKHQQAKDAWYAKFKIDGETATKRAANDKARAVEYCGDPDPTDCICEKDGLYEERPGKCVLDGFVEKEPRLTFRSNTELGRTTIIGATRSCRFICVPNATDKESY